MDYIFAIRALRYLYLGCALALPVGNAMGASEDEMPVAGRDWPSYNKTFDGQRYSPLKQINTESVATLKEVCRVQISKRGTFESGLIMVDQTLYLTTSTDTIAIDPVTCAVKWRHAYRPQQEEAFPVNRGAAYSNGRIFRGTADARLLALDASSGNLLWSDVVGNPEVGEYIPAVPIVWNGLVLIGTAGSEFGVKGRMMAYDAATGREIWRFSMIPTDKERGADSWKSNEWAKHGGGGTWSSFALDPVTSEVFVPVGNPVPDFAPDDRPGANLFTDSLVVLDARNGALKWWYQLVPHDGGDLDLGAAPMLYRDNQQRNVVALAGKDGYLHVVDRESHRLIFKTAVTTVDSSLLAPTAAGTRTCPGIAGGVEWNGPAFDSANRIIAVGSVDWCSVIKSGHASYAAGSLVFGGSWGVTEAIPRGWVVAMNADTGGVQWRYHADAPVLAGLTLTAGGIALGGDCAGNFLVFNSKTGAVLKKMPTGGALAGGIITYELGGRQFIALTSGNVSRTVFGASGRPSLVIMSTDASNSKATELSLKPDAARGRSLFRQSCAGCHGSDGNNVNGFDLRSIKNHMTAEQIVSWLENPAPPMPRVFPAPLDADDRRDMRDIAEYLLDGLQ